MSALAVSAPARRLRALAAASVGALLLAGCAGGDAASGERSEADDVVAVATTTQLGSLLEQIATCADVSVATVMGPGDDPHDFAASSAQVAAMARSGLVFANGLGLEAGMSSALRNAEADGATVVELAEDLDPLPFGAHDAHHADHDDDHHGDASADGHDHGSLDPHVWMDVARMATAAELMGQHLAEARDEPRLSECGRTVAAEIRETDAQVREILDRIPDDARRLIVDHDAYGYFADAYGFQIVGIVAPGGSTDAAPSSQRLAELTQTLRDAQADALITSAASSVAEVQSLASEAADVPLISLYEGGLGDPDSGAATYSDAMIANAEALAEALR
ncbi:MAG: metal ABC transporter substrate-binding protein [Micrococcus sp.]|nr:metal ABC transporter substrate-binding protein [Micrococcus sp.]